MLVVRLNPRGSSGSVKGWAFREKKTENHLLHLKDHLINVKY